MTNYHFEEGLLNCTLEIDIFLNFLNIIPQYLNSMKLVIPLHSLYWSIRTKDESKRGTAFAFIFGVN